VFSWLEGWNRWVVLNEPPQEDKLNCHAGSYTAFIVKLELLEQLFTLKSINYIKIEFFLNFSN
jgi:hypothetical protein